MIQNQIPFDGEVIDQKKYQENILYTLQHKGITYMVKRTPVKQKKKIELTLNQLIRQPEGRHPNIIKVYNVVEENGYIFIKMEYSDIGNIEQMKFNPQLIHQLIIEVIAALKHLDKFNIYHRDLKPQNIVYIDGHFKLIDFGTAKFYVDKNFQQQNSYIGSLPYMSPQVYLKLDYSNLCDIWSFGATLYHLIYQETIWDTMRINEQQIKQKFQNMLNNTEAIQFPKCKQTEYYEYLQLVKKMLAPLEENRITLDILEKEIYQIGKNNQESTFLGTVIFQDNKYNQILEEEKLVAQFFEKQLEKCKGNQIQIVLIFWGWKNYLDKIDHDNKYFYSKKMAAELFLWEYNQCPQKEKDKIDLFDQISIKELIRKQLKEIYDIIK